MSSLMFSNDSIFLLSRLELSLRKIIGTRYSLSDESSLVEMLGRAASSQDQSVLSLFNSFVNTINEDQKKRLIYRGVKVTRQPVQSPAAASDSAGAGKVVKTMYRGQVVYKSAAENMKGREQSSGKSPLQKPPRMYRGQVISD